MRLDILCSITHVWFSHTGYLLQSVFVASPTGSDCVSKGVYEAFERADGVTKETWITVTGQTKGRQLQARLAFDLLIL
jgi:hypothetical protein